jgi:hypothetical protein
MVAPLLGVLREINRVAKGERGIATFNDRRKIEHGNAGHDQL